MHSVCSVLAASLLIMAAGHAARAAVSDEEAAPHVINICSVSADTLAVVIRHGKVTPGRQEPYVKQAGDQLKPWRYHNWLVRDGKFIGTLAGPAHDVLYWAPKVTDQPLDETWADQATHYSIVCTSQDDPAYAASQSPKEVHRKSRPTELLHTDVHKYEGPREHLIYLSLPAPLKEGTTYRLSFVSSQPAIADATYKYEPKQSTSEAVHVSQIGFRPDDPLKLATLSLWLGDGGGMKYAEGLPFSVIRINDGSVVFSGHTQLAKAADDPELPNKLNYNGTDVWRMDFSSLRQPGEYRVYVESVGCSLPFRIADDVWQKAAYVSMRGLYHQRSGIAIGPPYTDFKRPRPFYPNDGVVVHISSAAYVLPGKETQQADLFKRLVEGDTGQTTRDAWGGYMDAGDFDRRIEHLIAARSLLDLITAYPEFKTLNLNIPESKNNLPDMIDEALWGIDCYRRMQLADGSVPAGIESAEHPRIGEASWQESHTIYRYAADPWSTGIYAATAAQAARVLKKYNSPLAEQYAQSALLAMQWIEQQDAAGKLADYDIRVPDTRNLAAVQMYALTGEPKWHDLFKKTSAFTTPQGKLAKWKKYDQGEAIFAYLNLPEAQTDTQIRKNGMQAIIHDANTLIDAGKNTAFGWTGDPMLRVAWGRLTTPRLAIPLIYAYRLTGDEKYLEAMVRACLYAAGDNPLNLCFTSGVGDRWPQHITNIDSQITNQVPPPGLTPLGPQEWFVSRRYWLNPQIKVHPELKNWPACEAYFDVGEYTVANEPTVHATITPTFYMWAHMAARPALKGGS